MNPESQLLVYTVKDVVYGGYKHAIANILSSQILDWRYLENLLIYHEMETFFYSVVRNEENLLPKQFYAFLKTAYYQKMLYHMLLNREISEIIATAHHWDITLIPIKGFSYPENYYKRYSFRPTQDIDLLAQKNQLEEGIRLLESRGYHKNFPGKENYWREHQCHLAFKKDIGDSCAIVELHWSIDIERGKKEILPLLWQRLKQGCLGGKIIPVLSPEDNLFCLAFHQRRFGKMLSLKYVCDTGLILEHERLDWDYILKIACQQDCRASLFFLLAHTQLILGKNLNDILIRLQIRTWQKTAISKLIASYGLRNPADFNITYLYVICHILIYDNIFYPLYYILNIPEEQFAKFYSLPLYSESTRRRYKLRSLYIPFKLAQKIINTFLLR